MFTKVRENLTAVPLQQHTPPIFGPSFFFPLLRLPLFWRVRGRSNRRPLLLSSAAIGMATLAEPHSYSLPILVTGLAHQATGQESSVLATSVGLLFFFPL